MTIQQLQYVLEIAKVGSISQAAKNLFLSQPNISNAVKNLENELNTTLFIRTPTGMVLTEQGEQLVQHAGTIIHELNEISAAVHSPSTYYFRLAYPRDIPSFEAFCDLCEKYQSCPELQLCCFHNSSPDVLTLLLRNLCDLCVCIQTPESRLRSRCSALHLEYVPLMRFPLCVQLSCAHPLLKEKEFVLSKLSDYPCTVFSSPDSLALNTEAFPFVNPSRLIRVESSTSRRDIVARTTAFSVVLPHSKEYNQKHGLVNIPIPNTECEIVYIYSSRRGLSALAAEYIAFLKKRLSSLDSN